MLGYGLPGSLRSWFESFCKASAMYQALFGGGQSVFIRQDGVATKTVHAFVHISERRYAVQRERGHIEVAKKFRMRLEDVGVEPTIVSVLSREGVRAYFTTDRVSQGLNLKFLCNMPPMAIL
jgi:hypothetical protein